MTPKELQNEQQVEAVINLQVMPGQKEHDVWIEVYEAKELIHLDQTSISLFNWQEDINNHGDLQDGWQLH